MPDLLTRAAATLLASYDGASVPAWVLRRVERGLGGVCLFGSNLGGSVEDVTGALHRVRPDVIVATDEEGGAVTRLWATVGSPVPGNAALGTTNDPATTRAVGAAVGARLAGAGIDLDLAPVADLNTDPYNPVIGVRSFGQDPDAVARHVAAFVEGLQGEGVAACVKHFPGHGATTVDSHLSLPVVDVSADVLIGRELVPFRAAIASGVAAVMSGHLVVTGIDRRPATVSRRLLVDLLRVEMGFAGAVVTDALDMGAVGGAAGVPGSVVEALGAGADLCCLGPGATDELVDACVAAIVAAVARGDLTDERLADAATRVSQLVNRPSAPRDPVDIEAIGLEAARRAVRIEGDTVLREPGAHVVELVDSPMIAAGDVPWSLGAALQAIDPTITISRSVAQGSRIPRPGGDETPLVVAYRDAHRHPASDRLLRALVAGRPDAVLVDLGWPHPDPPPARGRIVTFGAAPPCARAAAEILAGPLIPASASNPAGESHG